MTAQSTIARTNDRWPHRGIVRRDRPRNLYAEKTQHSSATFPPLTTQQLTREVQGIVLSFRTADVVDDTQASLRAIENVRNGESGMSLKTFVNLCRANPRARAMAAHMLGYGCESDPDVVQAISVLMNRLVREDGSQIEVRAISSDDAMPDACSGDDDSITGDLFRGGA